MMLMQKPNMELKTLAANIQKSLREMQISDHDHLWQSTLTDLSPAQRLVETLVQDESPDVAERMRQEFFGVGPLVSILDNESITEIIIHGSDSVHYELNGKICPHDDLFLSPLSFRNFLLRMERECGFEITLDRPFADGHWRGFRVHVAAPPVAARGEAAISLRRHPPNPWQLSQLQQMNWSDPEGFHILKRLIHEHRNFLIVGPTGSGKTSILNACLQELSQTLERIIIIEDTRELVPPNKVSFQLLTRTDAKNLLCDIHQTELVRQSLRMRPDRIVVGEIRGAEAKDLLMALATGHRGCMGTMHADSSRQALLRLEMLIQLGAPNWSLYSVRNLIYLSLSHIVVVERNQKNGRRQLKSISRITSAEEFGLLLEDIYIS